MRKKRHNYTPEEKVSILKRHLVEQIAVSDLCDEYQLAAERSSTSGRSSFLKTEQQPSLKTRIPSAKKPSASSSLKRSFARKHEVLSELMEEHIKLKKELGEL